MSLLLRLERRIEALVESVFSRWGRDRVHPLEIGRRLLREMDRGAIAGVGGMHLPNDYQVFLHPNDFAPYSAYTAPLIAELTDALHARAEELGGRLGGPVRIALAPREEITRGEIYVEARFLPGAEGERAQPYGAGHASTGKSAVGVPRDASEGDTRVYRRAAGSRRVRVHAGPVDHVDREFLLDRPVTTIGRRSDQDIVLPDPSVSRTHARIEIAPDGAMIVDLGSTNGTLVNGRAVRGARAALRPGDRIQLGTVVLEYLTVP